MNRGDIHILKVRYFCMNFRLMIRVTLDVRTTALPRDEINFMPAQVN